MPAGRLPRQHARPAAGTDHDTSRRKPDYDTWTLRLTPGGHIILGVGEEAGAEAVRSLLWQAFDRGTGHGLLHLGAAEVGTVLPPVLNWWRNFAQRYVAATRLQSAGIERDPGHAELPAVDPPDASERVALVLTAPMMTGSEYVTADLLCGMWSEIGRALSETLKAGEIGLNAWLHSASAAWNQLGRVYFNLAENRGDPEAPFAFMATYTTRFSAQAKAQHLPLGQALREYAGVANRDRLLSLLLPVQRAADQCAWLKPLIGQGDIYHPLRWSAGEAAQLLASAPDLEQAGIVLRMPASWQAGRPSRPKVTAVIGSRAPSEMGADRLMDFRMTVTLGGEVLSAREIGTLLKGTDQLVLLRGRWVEIDRARLSRTMERFGAAETLAARDGLNFAEAMRLLSGMDAPDPAEQRADHDWAEVSAGPWLAETLRAMRGPENAELSGDGDPVPGLHGTLRPYQKTGVAWLRLLSGLRLGACLADDMGLGKTIQVLSLLLARKVDATMPRASILVAPASLLANWAAEIERFAPSLAFAIVHPSAMPAAGIKSFGEAEAKHLDLVITTYGTLMRQPGLAAMAWRHAILDEAQAIKNPAAKQTRAAKALCAGVRIALTGTPVENSLGDLWSIFDFINPGLLGNARQFARYTKTLVDRADNPYGPLRDLVRPYILRRMKTDKSIVADLPDKTEVNAHCLLSRKQAALYAETVAHLARSLEETDGMSRRGLILASLLRLKQICNHPSHWLSDGNWAEAESGKFLRLRTITEEIAARQEKVLVFTQFREMTAPLAAHLARIFGRDGLVLHGGVPVRSRKALVTRFQDDETVPFLVLSLKAGGTGLTLTAASHVVHFDRWWNPAVEEQATDRAFRIGQKSNVMVNKFICKGTVEERIDALIESKKTLSSELLSGGGEINLTEMDDSALLEMVSLDLNAVAGE